MVKETVDQGGLNLVRGARRFAGDFPHLPSTVDTSRFARPDQSTNDAVGRQRRDIRAGQVDALAEHPNGSDRLILEGNY